MDLSNLFTFEYKMTTMDKLICLGKNYLEHALELGDAVPEMPVLFLKPPSVALTVDQAGASVQVLLPEGRGSVHHECEIILRLGKNGTPEAVSLGLDMTLRDLQVQLKKKGHPWEQSKVFQDSAVIGPWLKLEEFSTYLDEEFTFSLDGVVRQRGKGIQMRLSPEKCVSYAGEYFPLCPGDIIFTGTPAGVGPVTAGQVAEICWGSRLSFQVSFGV